MRARPATQPQARSGIERGSHMRWSDRRDGERADLGERETLESAQALGPGPEPLGALGGDDAPSGLLEGVHARRFRRRRRLAREQPLELPLRRGATRSLELAPCRARRP
jgi:hypothetical protein